MVDPLVGKVAIRRFDQDVAGENAEEHLQEMLDEIPDGIGRILGRQKFETEYERRLDEQVTAKVTWEGSDSEDEPVVSVIVTATVGVSADEDGLYGFSSASYEISGDGFSYDWHGEIYSFDHHFTADARKVHDKLKDKAPDIAKLFV